jgi:hypothetical protein
MVGRYVKEEFPNSSVHETVWVDPAAFAGEGAKGADPSWRQNFQKGLREELGDHIRVKKAPTKGNRLDERLQAVRTPMLRLVEGGEPGFMICPVRCKVLRRGFKGMYVIARTQLANGMGRFQDGPVKNDYSHVHDANQYFCLGVLKAGNDNNPGARHPGDREADMHRAALDRLGASGSRQVKVEGDYNVFSGRSR